MKITDVVVKKLFYPVDPPIADGVHFCSGRSLVLVEIHTSAGISGMGESAIPGAPMDVTEAIILKELRPVLLGEDPFRVEYLWQKMAVRAQQHGHGGMLYMAIGGLDIALYDIIGKAVKLPLYKLLGGCRETVRAYASAGFYRAGKSPAMLAEECRRFVEQGFQCIKIKFGRSWEYTASPIHIMPHPEYAIVSMAEDLERVRLVRQAIGDHIHLAIDVNTAWTPFEAIQMGRKLEEYKIFWLEEPVAVDDIEGSVRVAQALDIPVCGYETCTSLEQFRERIVRGAMDIVSPSISWCGGITEARRIAAFAHAYHLPVSTHGFGSGLTFAVNLHFLAGIPNGSLMEFEQNENPLRTEIFNEACVLSSNGSIQVPDRPGLGFTLKKSVIERYRVN